MKHETRFLPAVILMEMISAGFLMSFIACSPLVKGTGEPTCTLETVVWAHMTNTKTHKVLYVRMGIHEELRTARTKPQLATGPQKCVVFGPVGWLINVRRRALNDIC